MSNNNNNLTVPVTLIQDACDSIYSNFSVTVDDELFTDEKLSYFYTSHINKNKLVISFPVVASPHSAEVSFQVHADDDDDNSLYLNPERDSIKFNNAFKFEYNRVNGLPLQQNMQ